jgi:hypothetical protein
MLFSCDEHQGGWLRYAPFSRYQLPEIVTFDEVVHLNSGPEPETAGLYYLQWPGAGTPRADPLGCDIPIGIARKWFKMARGVAPRWSNCPVKLRELLADGVVPDPAPIYVAYHLAVNSMYVGYGTGARGPVWKGDWVVPRAVAGLPTDAVAYVLDKTFALDGHHIAAVKYLKWLAESHRNHPLLMPFDTVVREELMGIATEAARLYFMLLGDCIWDKDNKFFTRDPHRFAWKRLAAFLHFAGRVGGGRIEDQSGVDYWRRQPKYAFPGVLEAFEQWDEKQTAWRAASRLGGGYDSGLEDDRSRGDDANPERGEKSGHEP